MRVIVTRPLAQAEALVDELRRQGVDAVALPLIDIVPLRDPQPLRQTWRELPQLALLMFVSANAVQQFMAQRPVSFAWPPQALAGCTGPGSAAALREAGVPAAALVEPTGPVFDSEALWQQLRARDWQGRRVRVLRGESGRDWLAERFSQAGARVDFVAAYERRLPRLDPTGQALLDAAVAQPRQYMWVFSSSQAVANLGRLAPLADWSLASALAPHSRIVAGARRIGFGQVGLVATNAPDLAQAASAQSSAQSSAHKRRSIQSNTP